MKTSHFQRPIATKWPIAVKKEWSPVYREALPPSHGHFFFYISVHVVRSAPLQRSSKRRKKSWQRLTSCFMKTPGDQRVNIYSCNRKKSPLQEMLPTHYLSDMLYLSHNGVMQKKKSDLRAHNVWACRSDIAFFLCTFCTFCMWNIPLNHYWFSMFYNWLRVLVWF